MPLTDLHCHLGGAVAPAIMWGIAHSQGIKLPTNEAGRGRDGWCGARVWRSVPDPVGSFPSRLTPGRAAYGAGDIDGAAGAFDGVLGSVVELMVIGSSVTARSLK